jgi:PPOX class probable F420-dependent enzyme
VRHLAALQVEHRGHDRTQAGRKEVTVVIDPGTDRGRRVDGRLREELVAWLVTVAPDRTPVPTPVWFWWDGATLLVYSQPGKPKLDHIAANPTVALALRTDERGDLLAVVTGHARVDPDAPSADRAEGYLEKYRGEIARLGADPAGFAAAYAVAIRITPTKLRAW